MSESLFPPGTSVCVKQSVDKRDRPYEAEVVGVIEAWQELPTGSWYAHGRKNPGESAGPRLWLKRLKLRKPDGELTLLVIDASSKITKIETVHD